MKHDRIEALKQSCERVGHLYAHQDWTHADGCRCSVCVESIKEAREILKLELQGGVPDMVQCL